MKTIYYLLFLLTITNCRNEKSLTVESSKSLNPHSDLIPEPIIRSLKEISNTEDGTEYKRVIKSIVTSRDSLVVKEGNMDSFKKLFTQSLLNKIIPFWEGTPWTFEGHTSVPKAGSIACGYFVSTTLKDVGLQLNRYKLAQQNPHNEARTLALDSEIIIINEKSNRENIIAIQKQINEGIYFIGFDNSHVGFITKINNQLYLIHSNYMGSQGVTIEHIDASQVFQSYSKYYIAELSSNTQLIEKWINEIPIEVLD